MRAAIVGCGSLGGVIAVRLAQDPKIELCVLNRNPAIAAAASRRGLLLTGPGRRTVSARPLLCVSPPPGSAPFDVIVLATKSNGLRELCASLLPALAPTGVLVTLQNGLVGLELAEAFGPERVIPGSVLWGASMTEPGAYRITATGPFILGDSLGRSETPALSAAAALLALAFPVRTSAAIQGVLWSKLAINCAFTSLGALSGLRFGSLARRGPVRRQLLAIGAEVLAAAGSQGVRLEALTGGLDPRRLLEPGGYPPLLRHALILALGWKHRRTESAMLDSLNRGRPTEIDFLNGLITDLAERTGLPTPWNRCIRELVLELEAGRLAPHPANLALLAGRVEALDFGSGGTDAR